MMRWNKSTADAAIRVVLRSLPILPGPEVYDFIRSVGRSEQDLDRQIKEAFDALSKSSDLVDTLEKILKEREKKLLSLQTEYERVSELSKMTQDQASAVAASLEIALGRSAVRERIISFAINIFAGLILFVIGVLASDQLKDLLRLHH